MKTMKLASTILALLIAAYIFSACSKFEYDNSTIFAKVTAIDGQKVTLLVGEMNIDENMMQGDFNGDMSNFTPPTDDGNIPQMPNEDLGEMPTLPEGETMPEGELPEMPSDGSIPEMPDGGMQLPNGELPEGMGNMQMPFVAGDDTITLTLNEEIVKTLSVDSIVQITFGDNGSVEALNIVGGNMQGGFGGGNPFNSMTPPESGEVEGSTTNNANS